MQSAETPVPGSTVVLVDHDRSLVPPWQAQRLERTLARFFPAGCGLKVLVTAGWNGGSGSWQVSRVLVESGVGFRNFTRRVRDGLAAQGLPVDTGAVRPGQPDAASAASGPGVRPPGGDITPRSP